MNGARHDFHFSLSNYLGTELQSPGSGYLGGDLRAVCLRGDQMIRAGLTLLILATTFYGSTSSAQNPSAPDPTDLKVELRSATGSNRFQLGEVIPLQILISSSTPNRYLEPCKLFWESCFGYPQCRYVTKWSFDVTPTTGWTDIGWHGCMQMSGPTIEVKSSDLTSEPKEYSYTLTNRFRFDSPGKYTVRLSITVGLDDERNQIRRSPDAKQNSNFVSKTAKMDLEIVPAGDDWKKSVIAQGVAAWTAPPDRETNPPSPGFLKHQQEKAALCSLGTRDAAIALAGLLSRGIDVAHCLRNNANKDAAQAEMRRLLVDSNVGVRPVFFAAYAKLLSPAGPKSGEIAAVPPNVVNEVRETLFASLKNKTPDALIPSLETVLRNPMNGYWVIPGSAYDLHEPFSDDVIRMAAANFDRLSEVTQAALLDADWDHLRSPLMLPLLRRKAEAGNGQALVRWLELDPTAATAFMRQEVVRPEPRFSSLYLRLPDKSLPEQEQQIARNFVALSSPEELIRAATLLHRYTTRVTLPTTLPFIDEHLTEWPCNVQIPVLAYLLKVSPQEARPRLERVLQKLSPPYYCPRGEFFPSLGFMEASPVLDVLAAKQVEDGTPHAADAAEYLGRFGGSTMKPIVWEQLFRWHKKYVASGAKQRITTPPSKPDDSQLYNLDSRLLEAYTRAQGWTLSPEDVLKLKELMGDKETGGLACTFSCGSELSVGPAPGSYHIYGKFKDPVYPFDAQIDYLMPTEPYRYTINQYRCADLKSLEQKLLQFPAGSTFSVAHTGSLLDGWGDWTAIGEFLRSHGYSFRNEQR
ncbi:MAG TPA: hypothetical protein VJS11_07535 [Acidobacteriaceae bacterium]|nr:hypothetical protein [Acidobacteriaceae bacterium]